MAYFNGILDNLRLSVNLETILAFNPTSLIPPNFAIKTAVLLLNLKFFTMYANYAWEVT